MLELSYKKEKRVRVLVRVCVACVCLALVGSEFQRLQIPSLKRAAAVSPVFAPSDKRRTTPRHETTLLSRGQQV